MLPPEREPLVPPICGRGQAGAYPHAQLGDLPVPDGERYHEHPIRWFSDPETRLALVRLGYDSDTHLLPPRERLRELPPICCICGKANRLLPYEVEVRQLEWFTPDEVHVLEGRGYAAAWESPEEISRIIESCLARDGRFPTRRVRETFGGDTIVL